VYMYVYVYMYVCLCIYMHIHLYTRACGCTFLTLACVCVGGLEVGFVSVCSWLALVAGVGGYVLAGVEIGVCFVYFSIFAGIRVVRVCVLVYARTHTQTTRVLDVSPGVGRTPGEPEEPRSTKAHYTCRPYRCTKYICLYICCAAGFDGLG